VSGRGVGLDVVRTAVRQLRGTVRVESEPQRFCYYPSYVSVVLRIGIEEKLERGVVFSDQRRYHLSYWPWREAVFLPDVPLQVSATGGLRRHLSAFGLPLGFVNE